MSGELNRRRFVQRAAAGGTLLGLGDLSFLRSLPRVTAAESELAANMLQLRPRDLVSSAERVFPRKPLKLEIDQYPYNPLVRLLETTSREQLLEAVAAKITSGTSYQEVLAALLLAAVHNVEPRPSVGFKFHAVLVVNSVHLASLASPDTDRWLPIFWALDYFKSAHDLDLLVSDVPLEIMLRIWARPTFEVHGFVGGHMGPGVKAIVPNEAELKISFRLVPKQDPEQIGRRLVEFVRQINPDIEVEVPGFMQPYQGPYEGPVHEAIVAGMTTATGKAPVTVREGGSIGAVPILADLLGVPVHFLPLSLPEHGYHAPNERFDWKQAKVGMTAFSRVFERLAT